MKTTCPMHWNCLQGADTTRWAAFLLVPVMCWHALADDTAAAQERPTLSIPFSIKGWGERSSPWGEAQQDARATIVSGSDDPNLGRVQSIAAGDLNGDGCTDIVLGKPGASEGSMGGIDIYYGTAQGWEKDWQSNSKCTPVVVRQHLATQERSFGQTLRIDDLTGDGYSELVVAAPASDIPGRAGAGKVYLFRGSEDGLGYGSATLTVEEARVSLTAGTTDACLGVVLSPTEDLTGDGIRDLWVVSQQSSSAQGEVCIASALPKSTSNESQTSLMAQGSLPRAILLPGNECWSPDPAPDCSRSENIDADSLNTFQLTAENGSGSQFGAQVLAWPETAQLLVADPTGVPDGGFQPFGLIFSFGLVGGTQSTDELTSSSIYSGDKSTYGEPGHQSLLVKSEDSADATFLLFSAHRWGYMQGDAYLGKLGRLYLQDELGQQLSFERPAWLQAEEEINGRGLGTSIELLPPLSFTDIDTKSTMQPHFRTRSHWPELAIGSPGYCRSQQSDYTSPYPGFVYLMSSETLVNESGNVADEGMSLPVPFGWEGVSGGDCFGDLVIGGDFNGDGFHDLAVFARDAEAGAGSLTVLWSVERLIDSDGDGHISYPGMLIASDDISASWADLIDGQGNRYQGGDCDESNAQIHTGISEICNGQDDNCDGRVDIDDNGNDLRQVFYLDNDGDGFGRNPDPNDTTSTRLACKAEPPYVEVAGDCQDDATLPNSAQINPNAQEVCNGINDDCDENTIPSPYDEDKDQDGVFACESTRKDCDDQDASVNSLAPEICDGKDNNCDHVLLSAEHDFDGDCFLACTPSTTPGSTPTDPGFAKCNDARVFQPGDCDDEDVNRYPGAAEDPATFENEDCRNKPFGGCTSIKEWRIKRESGCLALDIQHAAVAMLLPLTNLFRLRRRWRGKQRSPKPHSKFSDTQ